MPLFVAITDPRLGSSVDSQQHRGNGWKHQKQYVSINYYIVICLFLFVLSVLVHWQWTQEEVLSKIEASMHSIPRLDFNDKPSFLPSFPRGNLQHPRASNVEQLCLLLAIMASKTCSSEVEPT